MRARHHRARTRLRQASKRASPPLPPAPQRTSDHDRAEGSRQVAAAGWARHRRDAAGRQAGGALQRRPISPARHVLAARQPRPPCVPCRMAAPLAAGPRCASLCLQAPCHTHPTTTGLLSTFSNLSATSCGGQRRRGEGRQGGTPAQLQRSPASGSVVSRVERCGRRQNKAPQPQGSKGAAHLCQQALLRSNRCRIARKRLLLQRPSAPPGTRRSRRAACWRRPRRRGGLRRRGRGRGSTGGRSGGAAMRGCSRLRCIGRLPHTAERRPGGTPQGKAAVCKGRRRARAATAAGPQALRGCRRRLRARLWGCWGRMAIGQGPWKPGGRDRAFNSDSFKNPSAQAAPAGCAGRRGAARRRAAGPAARCCRGREAHTQTGARAACIFRASGAPDQQRGDWRHCCAGSRHDRRARRCSATRWRGNLHMCARFPAHRHFAWSLWGRMKV